MIVHVRCWVKRNGRHVTNDDGDDVDHVAVTVGMLEGPMILVASH
jgi:hypothetical protein